MYRGSASLITVQLLKSQEVVVRGFCDYVEEVIVQQLRETIHLFSYTCYEREAISIDSSPRK